MNAGGAERVASTLVNAWAARGDSVTLMPTFSGRGGIHYEIHPGVKLVFLADLHKKSGGGLIQKIKRLSMLRKFIKSEKPDVIISFLTNVNIATLLASARLDMPVIACERVNPFLVPLPVSQRIARRIVYPFADCVLLQTDALAQECAKVFFPRWETFAISNPLPPQFQAIERQTTQDKSRLKIIAIGRLDTQKQFNHLIQAFAKIANRHVNWDLDIVGEGPLRDQLLALTKELQLDTRVKLLGPSKDVAGNLSRADIFALTSRYEGFPNALIEAMAAGLPCVTFDCPSGPREISDNGQLALLVPQNNVDSLADALEKLISDAPLREQLGTKAQHAIRNRLSIDQILRKWDLLFERVKSPK